MSTTTRSPACDRAVGQLVVRAGPVRPRADDREVDPDVALREDRRGDVGARPRPRCGRPAATPPSGRAPGRWRRRPAASSSISAARLDHAQPVERPGWRAPAPSRAAPAGRRGRARPRCGRRRRPGRAPTRGGRWPRRRAGRTGRRSRPRPAPRGRGRRPGWRRPSAPPGGARPGTARPGAARPARSAAPWRARCSPRGSAGRSPGVSDEQVDPGLAGELPRGVHPVDRHERTGRVAVTRRVPRSPTAQSDVVHGRSELDITRKSSPDR